MDDKDVADDQPRATSEECIRTVQTPLNERSLSGCNPGFINSLTYCGAILTFLLAIEIHSLPRLPLPITGSLLVSNNKDFAARKDIRYLFIAMWGAHFIRRFLEVLFVHQYKRKMSIFESIGAPIYYWFFALWIAWSLNPESGYKPTYLMLVIAGVILFLLGEVGNCTCHFQLRRFRSETPSTLITRTSYHVLPHGSFFSRVSCPHYSFEIISWIGFFLATWTLSALFFLLATIGTLLEYSHKRHEAYLREFDGEMGRKKYPSNRKALIPWIF